MFTSVSSNRTENAGSLVIAPGALGDTVLRALALRHLVDAGVLRPPLHVVGSPGYLAVFRTLLPGVRVRSFEERIWADLFADAKKTGSELCGALRGVNLALVWLPEDPRALARLKSCGVGQVRWGDPLLARSGEHQLHTLLRVLGLDPAPLFNPTAHQAILETQHREQRVLVHPGAGSPRKRLPARVYRRISEGLEEDGWEITWLLGPAEEGATDLRNAAAGFRTRTCADLGELLEVLQEYQLVLGNDSGVEHLAAALGKTVISFFVSTDPERWHAVGPLVVTVDVRSRRPQVRVFRGLHEEKVDRLVDNTTRTLLKVILEILGDGTTI